MVKYLAIDTETHLIQPGCLTPPLVCLSYSDSETSGVLGKKAALKFFREKVEEGYTFVLHNGAFDLAVLSNEDESLLPLIFKLYEDGRVKDTMVREMLFTIREGTFAISRKGFSLNALAKKYMDEELDKAEDSWRYRYHELENVLVKDWPEEAYEYAVKDAEVTYDVFFNQESSPDEDLQVSAAWGLHLLSVYGVVTDVEAVSLLEDSLKNQIAEVQHGLVEAGVLRTDKKKGFVKNTKVIRDLVEKTLGKDAERTNPSTRHPEGQVKIDSKACKKTGNKDLLKLIEYSETEKLLTTYVPLLKQGTEHPINARFNVLVETGRTSCQKPNLQNQPRKPGVRECFIPRKGFAYVACDYDTVELRALSQVCYSLFGESAMREAIIEGRDLHLDLASTILGVDYEEAKLRKTRGDKDVKEARQFAKIANFGFPGGLGAPAFVKYANGFGYDISHRFASTLRDAWFRRWPEMRPYFEKAASVSGDFGSKRVKHFYSNRIRGGVRFTQAANTLFQGLVADGAKMAVFAVQKECWIDSTSPMYQCRPVVFIHDEILMETPEEIVDSAAKRLSHVMNREMQKVMPDVPITSEAHAMSRWFKNAEPVYDDSGKLKIWSE